MANIRFEGGAAVKTDTRTYAFGGTWEADDVIRVQVGNKIKDVTGGSVTTATVVTTLAAAIVALSADDFPEMVGAESGFLATASTTTLTLTANKPGVPFICTLTPLEVTLGAADAQTIGGVGTATTGTVSVANAGSTVWDTAANWDGGVVPVVADAVFFDHYSGDVLYGLSNAGATLASLNFARSFTGLVGLPKVNNLGEEYPEYRTEYLTIDATLVRIGYGPGEGAGRIKLNNGSVQTAVTVDNTGTPVDEDLEAVLWKGTHASNTMTVRGDGSVGVAVFGGEVATLATLTVEGNSNVRCGLGTTLTTVTVNGGSVELNSNVTTLTVNDGTVTVNGTMTVGQLTINRGLVIYNSTGTLSGSTVVGENGSIDFGQGVGAVTVSNPIDSNNLNPVNDPDKRIVSLVVDYNGVTPLAGFGTNVRLTRAAVA